MKQLKRERLIPRDSRILGYDFARALAVMGMIIVNFRIVMWNSEGGSYWLNQLIGILEGKAAATFMVLAGIGITLLSRRGVHENNTVLIKEKRKLLLKRSLFLFFGGLLYTTIWPADILHFYGIYLVFGAVLFTASSRNLLIFSWLIMGIWTLLNFIWDYQTGWDFTSLTYLDLWTFRGMLRHYFFNGFHPVFPWMAFLFFGMWLGRMDLTESRRRWRMLCWALGIFLAVQWGPKLMYQGLGLTFGISADHFMMLTGTTPIPPMPLFIIAGGATAVIVICISLEFVEKFGHMTFITPLIHTGQMALTIYILHVVIGMGVIEEFFGLGKHSLDFTVKYATSFCLLSILFSHWWRKRFKRGPVGWVMRKISG